MTLVVDFTEQRSAEWFALRAGRLTGSVAADMLATLKSGQEAASRRDLRVRLAIERITGQPILDDYINREMQRGIDLEPLARAHYEAATGLVAHQSGFVYWEEDPDFGCSLDGMIGSPDGILELKCPKSATHVGYLKSPTPPSDYLPQITHNLWVTGAEWCDFCSFDDRLPEGLQFLRRRVYAKDLDIAGYAAKANAFMAEVRAEVAALEELRRTA